MRFFKKQPYTQKNAKIEERKHGSNLLSESNNDRFTKITTIETFYRRMCQMISENNIEDKKTRQCHH